MRFRQLFLRIPLSPSGAAAGWAPLPIRLIVGFGFLAHGYVKLSRGPESFGGVLQTLGVPVPHLLAWLTTLVELIGGSAVLAGAFIPFVSVPMAVVLLYRIVHRPFPVWILLGEVCRGDDSWGPIRACWLRNHPALLGRAGNACSRRSRAFVI
ncbi:DoxX family protein [Mesorhizobium sp. WSM4313]|uniref:DoxX family protein n=1 Tax=Mesorhizobium sp. WSM4313 TaxID=2029412 RepID=UPI001AEC7FFE|nr:DoxX family protein [Mesorhizobium sp. WSM4313]